MVEAAHFRFADALLADTSLMPIWPGPHPYQLTFVPHLASPSMVCVHMHYEGTLRSIIIPRRLDYSDLICTVRFHLGQDVNQVRLPPALHAKRIHAPDRPMHLRDGDLLDVLASRPSRREVVRQSCFLKDKILWTRDFDIGDDIAVRLWMPHIQGPLFTWLEPGSRWDACDLTFTGSFRDRFPGCWVPVQWCPGQSPHLVQVPAEPRVVSVLHDSSHGVAGLQVVSNLARSELAEILHTLPSQLLVLGYPHVSADHIMSLRDGDVLWDSMNYEDTHSEWPYIADAVSEALFLFGLGLTGGRPGFLVAVLSLLHCTYGTREHGPPSRARSRSHSANQRRGYPPSPRAGRWRPELSHPMTEVFSSRHCEYRILCPFRGWHSVNTALPSSSYDFLLSAVRFVTGPWADDFLVLGPDAYGEPLVFLPIKLGPLVTLLVTSGGLTKAILFPRRACFHDLQQYCQRLFTLTGLPLRGPPALRHYMTHPWVPVTLRSGDTFSLHIPDTFHAFRSVPHPTADHPNMLPQLNLWHVDFQLLEGGWVYVWNDAGPPDLHRQRVWIDACSIWTPTCRQFRRPGELPRNFAWVPVPCLGDGRCHFVRATDEGEARILLHDETGTDETECRLVTNLDRRILPLGYTLRPDIENKEQNAGLRDGDVLVPVPHTSSAGRAILLGALCKSPAARLICLLALSLGIQLGAAMFAPPIEQQSVEPPPVGLYPWRVPCEQRMLHLSVLPGTCGTLLSPYTTEGEPVELMPDTLVDDVYVALSSREPVWYHSIAPVWPVLGMHTITFVPVPPCRELVCVVVVSSDWKLPLLLPRRADLDWVLAHVHRNTPGAVVALRGPLGASTPDRTNSDAVDWRNGDVLLAVERHAPGRSLHVPVFTDKHHVRHSALWIFDFTVDCMVELTIWRPNRPPVTTEMPAGATWDAQAQRFRGRFEEKYPGAWVPVPWAFNAQVHLCRRATDPTLCNVLLESVKLIDGAFKLRAACHTVHQASTCVSIAGALNLPTAHLRLIGVPEPADDFPALRDGDVLHYALPDDSHATGPLVRFSFWLALGATRNKFLWAIATALILGSLAAPPCSSAVQADHWLWSPYQGRLGPVHNSPERHIADQLFALEPIWVHGFVGAYPQSPDGPIWVPRSPSPALASVLFVGPPLPVLHMLPYAMPRSLLLRIMRHLFGNVREAAGRHLELRPKEPPDRLVKLRDGDVLVAIMEAWVPNLLAPWPQHFLSVCAARDQGLWSQPLSFHGRGWAFLWQAGRTGPTSIALSGTQHWDPVACALRPALAHISEGLWPRLTRVGSSEPHLHFSPAHSEEFCEPIGPAADFPCPPGALFESWYADEEGPTLSAARRAGVGLPLLVGVIPVLGAAYSRGPLAALSWLLLSCYLAAWGSPGDWFPLTPDVWGLSLEDACRLQAWLHHFWRMNPLRPYLPCRFPATYHAAWNSFPVWSGGVPDELLIATDGSGISSGSCAFAVWALYRSQWYRIGWFAADLPSVAWYQGGHSTGSSYSFQAEIVALQSAALWALSACDNWSLNMHAGPAKITVAVDNTSALQVAAGYASAGTADTTWCRGCWQAVQSRCNTTFRHIPSHTGFLVNTIADALADYAAHGIKGMPHMFQPVAALHDLIRREGPWLWTIPHAQIYHSVPHYLVHADTTLVLPTVEEGDSPDGPEASGARPMPLPLHIVTANVQSLKDAPANPFNPSGHASRRQFMYDQAQRLQIDVMCLPCRRLGADKADGILQGY